MNIREIVDNFGLFSDWEDKYRYLIDLGRLLPIMPDALKTEGNKVRGCMSQVWIVLGWDKDKKLVMEADSDALIVRGLISVLRIIFQGKTESEIAEIDVGKIFATLGLDQHLSPNRRNGFYAMVERIHAFIAGGK